MCDIEGISNISNNTSQVHYRRKMQSISPSTPERYYFRRSKDEASTHKGLVGKAYDVRRVGARTSGNHERRNHQNYIKKQEVNSPPSSGPKVKSEINLNI